MPLYIYLLSGRGKRFYDNERDYKNVRYTSYKTQHTTTNKNIKNGKKT